MTDRIRTKASTWCNRANSPLEVTAKDADIIWLYDLIAESGIHPHDSAHSSILLDGKLFVPEHGQRRRSSRTTRVRSFPSRTRRA